MAKHQSLIAALKNLERTWPTDGTMLLANGNFLYLCTKHPEDGGREIASFHIPNDGGDPDWQYDTTREANRKPKQLVPFTRRTAGEHQ